MMEEEEEGGEWWKMIEKDLHKYEIHSKEQLEEFKTRGILKKHMELIRIKHNQNEEKEHSMADVLPDIQILDEEK